MRLASQGVSFSLAMLANLVDKKLEHYVIYGSSSRQVSPKVYCIATFTYVMGLTIPALLEGFHFLAEFVK